MLQQGKPVPLTSLRIVDADEISQLLERMRINVPSSIRESERMLAERDLILTEAQNEAQRTIEGAKARARELLSQDALVLAAQREADRVIEESRLMAKRRTEEADRYATDVLKDLAEKLHVISQQVNNGIRMLQDSAAEGETRGETQPAHAALS